MTTILSTFWMGPRLGRVERACMLSWLRHGHEVHLYRYATPEGVPQAVELKDASAVLPERRVICHQNGSVSLFSNLFRYELQRRALGTWLDCDVYLLGPIDAEPPDLFGEEESGRINGAVLRLPPDSALLADLIELFDESSVPSWLPLRARMAAYWRLFRTGRAGVAQMPWGMTGPTALTAVARRHGLLRNALPPDTFYPRRWQDADWIRDPSIRLDDVVTPRTLAIHLWNERIRAFKEDPAPPGSFLARLQTEGEYEQGSRDAMTP